MLDSYIRERSYISQNNSNFELLTPIKPAAYLVINESLKIMSFFIRGIIFVFITTIQFRLKVVI